MKIQTVIIIMWCINVASWIDAHPSKGVLVAQGCGVLESKPLIRSAQRGPTAPRDWWPLEEIADTCRSGRITLGGCSFLFHVITTILTREAFLC